MENGLAHCTVEAPELYIALATVTIKLNSLGGWFDNLDNQQGVICLAFRAPEANISGFERWLSRATNGSGKLYRNA